MLYFSATNDFWHGVCITPIKRKKIAKMKNLQNDITALKVDLLNSLLPFISQDITPHERQRILSKIDSVFKSVMVTTAQAMSMSAIDVANDGRGSLEAIYSHSNK